MWINRRYAFVTFEHVSWMIFLVSSQTTMPKESEA